MTAEDLDYRGRRNGAYDWDGLHSSISKNGITEPLEVHVDGEGNKTMLNGHHRYIAAKNLGLTHVPVRFTHG
jgi:ParB-like chromosome segregation protein Spo0J